MEFHIQGWTAKAERIRCSAPLPENPANPLLTRMLVPVPYQVPVKKDKKKKNKEAKSGPHHEGTSDAMFGGTEAPSSHEGDENDDEEEEEEDNPPLKGKKRAASAIRRRGRPRGERYPSRMIRIRAPKLSPSTAPEPSPLPNRKYLKTPYVHSIFL